MRVPWKIKLYLEDLPKKPVPIKNKSGSVGGNECERIMEELTQKSFYHASIQNSDHFKKPVRKPSFFLL